ncbi:MAG: hypothetical protein EA401_06285, partial [Planctomycetota bacterium]
QGGFSFTVLRRIEGDQPALDVQVIFDHDPLDGRTIALWIHDSTGQPLPHGEPILDPDHGSGEEMSGTWRFHGLEQQQSYHITFPLLSSDS